LLSKAVPEKAKEMIRRFTLGKNQAVIAIAALTVVALIITGIIMHQATQALIETGGVSQHGEPDNSRIYLEIFKFYIVMLLIVTAGAVSIMLLLSIKLEYIYRCGTVSGIGLYVFDYTDSSFG